MKFELPETTYNFEVDGFHTYYVGYAHVLVHNTCLENKKIAGPKDVVQYKNVRIDVELGDSGKANIHMHADGLDKMYYENGAFQSAPTKLSESDFVKRGIEKVLRYVLKRGWEI